jgi:hypothetical protein
MRRGGGGFEAWEQAAERADFDRMAEYVQAIGRDSLIRRVGAVLEMVGAGVTDASTLGGALRAAKGRTGSHDEMIPLLPGLGYRKAEGTWRVFVP